MSQFCPTCLGTLSLDEFFCYPMISIFLSSIEMKPKFSGQLEAYIQQAGLSLRKMSRLSGIPHQTIYNWIKGSKPRWHTSLKADLHRLGNTLDLSADEIALLLELAGCSSVRSERFFEQEIYMDKTYRVPEKWTIIGEAPHHPDHYEIAVVIL